jgi:hypothetical protein
MQFVPKERRSENVPCHHIALNDSGDTVDRLECRDNQQELEEKVKNWLRAAIARMERERASTKGSG